MEAYRIEREIAADGNLLLTGLPFLPGRRLEIIVLPAEEPANASAHAIDYHPMKGRPFTYIDPFEPVAAEDWEAAQ